MISRDLEGLTAALGDMAGRVNEEAWMQLRRIRDNLAAKAEQAKALEENLIPEAVAVGEFSSRTDAVAVSKLGLLTDGDSGSVDCLLR